MVVALDWIGMKHTIVKQSHLPLLTKYLSNTVLHGRQPVHNFKILYARNLFAVHYHVLFRFFVQGRYVMLLKQSPILQIYI